MAHPPIIGELVVVALKAEKLQHQAAGKQDPFCLFRVAEIIKRTKTDYGGGLYPIWDDQVNIPVAAGHSQMHVQIFDKDTMSNNLMGEGTVDLTKVLREKEHDDYFPLQYRGKQGEGVIYLELTFYSAVSPSSQHQNSARPQQQVRYQYPPGHVPGGGNFRPPPPHQHRPPPLAQQQQHRPPPLQQHRPPPSQQQQHRPPPPPQQQRPPSQQQRPPPQQQRPPHQQQHPNYPQQHYNSRPPPMHIQTPLMQQNQRPLPQPPIQQHRPPPQSYSRPLSAPLMPSGQPLLSAPYQPAPSPATRPACVSYPNQQGAAFPTPAPYAGPPGGYHDPLQQQQQYPPQGGFYPPQPQNTGPPPQGGFYPPQQNSVPPPHPPSSMGYPRPTNTMNYPYQ